MPKISVLMSVYNGEKYLSSAIESILSQTEKDFEFVIINDGSSDSTPQIIKKYLLKDSRIVYIDGERRGLVAALNHGISVSKGEYLARMDADDIALPDRLEVQLKFLDDNKKVIMCGSWLELIDSYDTKIGENKSMPISAEDVRKTIVLHNPFAHPSVMIRKKVFDDIGGYRTFFRHIEDYELWTRILQKYEGVNIPRILLRYRQHLGQVTVSKNIEMRLRGILVRILALWRVFVCDKR